MRRLSETPWRPTRPDHPACQRPLTDGQLAYAARDAGPLPRSAADLVAKLAAAVEFAALRAVSWAAPVAADSDRWAGLAAAAEANRDRLAGEMDGLAPGVGGRLFDGCTNWDSSEQLLAAFRAAGVGLPYRNEG